LAVRKLGVKRAKLFHRRLEYIADPESFSDFKHLPGRFHQLKEDRNNQWACDLDHPYRQIFKPAEISIPIDKKCKQILSETKSVGIVEIKNYH